MNYQCRYCKRSFVKEITLTHHVCEKKRRFQQEKEIGVQWALQAYLTFYQTTQSGSVTKTYTDFVESAYYTAFVKFGRHCHSIHCINFINYTRWLLKTNRKLDSWCSDKLYEEWLFDYLRRENIQDALERSMQTMINYTAEHEQYRNGHVDYFRLVNENRICHHITTGRISPWVVYNCASGQDFLNRLTNDQINAVNSFIDPDFWASKFRDSASDTAFAQQILLRAGL